MSERNEVYDKLCRILTDYEEDRETADALYDMLVEVQNKWETVITANL